MSWQITQLRPEDAKEALALLQTLSDKGEVLYKPIEEEDFLSRFFGENRWGFTARSDDGKLIGWIHGTAKTSFLNGETAENTPMYLTMILVDEAWRRQGVGTALLEALKQTGREIGKKTLIVSGDNPVHLTWLIPGAGGHDHNNAPGVDENGLGFAFFKKHGFEDKFREISLYMNLKNFQWNPKLDEMIAKLKEEGIYVGRWQMGMGEEYDGMCDRVGSEYWRNVLKRELKAWHTGEPNDDPEHWPDGIQPTGPRPILVAVKDEHIIGFTGPVDLQQSGRGWFTGICADPEWGGRGIGTVLFNMLMREFVEEGAQFSSLFTGLDNHAQKIYMRAGMHVTANFVIMSCTLDDSAGYEKRYF